MSRCFLVVARNDTTMSPFSLFTSVYLENTTYAGESCSRQPLRVARVFSGGLMSAALFVPFFTAAFFLAILFLQLVSMGLLPASPKAWSDSSRAVNHNLEYRSHDKRFKRCDDATPTKKHEKFLSLVTFAFLVLQEL